MRFISVMSMRIQTARSGTSMLEQLLDGEGEHQLVEQRRRVVHAGDVGGALEVGEVLARLLHAGVEVADDRLGPQRRSRPRARA